jgi:NMD protein affecting ribosome stability and mRNA decay
VPADANKQICPACLRIRDRLPAGYLALEGDFLSQHEEEIMNLIHNYEARERALHPLKRIMEIEKRDEGIVMTFTDAHLARGVGDAIHRAYEGELDYQYTKGDVVLRVNWSR